VTTRINYGITLGIDVRKDPSKAKLSKLPDGIEEIAKKSKATGELRPNTLPKEIEEYEVDEVVTVTDPYGGAAVVVVTVKKYRVRPGVVPAPGSDYVTTNGSNTRYTNLDHARLNRIDSVIDIPGDANSAGQRTKVIDSLATLDPTEKSLLLSPTRKPQLQKFVVAANNPADRDRLLAALPLSDADKQTWRAAWEKAHGGR
jgi:hypothetical protein